MKQLTYLYRCRIVFFILIFYCFERKTHLPLFIWEYTFRKLIVRCHRRIFQTDINICLLHFSRNHPFLFSYWTNLKFLTLLFLPSITETEKFIVVELLLRSIIETEVLVSERKFSAFSESFVFRYILISKLRKCCFRQAP